MSFGSDFVHMQSQFSRYPPPNPMSIHKTFRIREFRVWKRRRLKSSQRFAVRNNLGHLISNSFENLFGDMISKLPSGNSLDLIAPALGFVSGVALYFSRRKTPSNFDDSDIGDWILFTSPTPFNRFVLLRCPSIEFEDSELLEGVNEKLVTEERHYVNLNRGRIPVLDEGNAECEENLVYQRTCIRTDDGGVLSLDWPANLDLMKEHGLDTTLVLVPGTAEGSMDRNIRSFVCDVLQHGCFPIVMNPRGCGGSPLTTARLFTAADSDDISTAIQFINRSRPWTTLMIVGWGYGANMLTKYLAEVGERTPLTAAACIDNPFDLEEATRSLPHHIATDQKLTGGLIDILRANKELFEGRRKGFNIAGGLSATSLRDFEKSISMVSYGFDAVEEFYSKSSTRQLVGNLKIPVLFILSDDGTVPLLSIPRSSIAENPFTSLLLCSCMPASTIKMEKSAIPWCQNLVIEWLAAVELALLKGHHPLLQDVDVTINPSKGLALVEGRPSDGKISRGDGITSSPRGHSYLTDKNGNVDHLLNHTPQGVLNGFPINRLRNVPEGSDIEAQDKISHLRMGRDVLQKQSLENSGSKQMETIGTSQPTSSDGTDLVKEEADNASDGENREVTQTAEFVINMLDVTMPGTLADEQKGKVLSAVGQGETFMKALQEAVPDDVRGKLSAAVSEIVHTHRSNLNIAKLIRGNLVADGVSDVKSKVQAKLKGASNVDGGYSSSLSAEYMINDSGSEKKSSQGENLSDNNEKAKEKLAYRDSDNVLSSETVGNQADAEKPSRMRDYNEAEQNSGTTELSQDKSKQTCVETGPAGEKPSHQNRSVKASDNEEASGEKQNQSNDTVGRDSAEHQAEVKGATDIEKNGEEGTDAAANQNKSASHADPEESSLTESTTEHQLTGKEGNDVQKSEDKNVQDISQTRKADEPSRPISSSSSPPSISVSQALDALTGIDDSTQMAVNSVFGVIENMIDQLEKGTKQSNDGKQNEPEDQKSASNKPSVTSKHESEKKEHSENGCSRESKVMLSNDNRANNSVEEGAESHQDVGKEPGQKKLMKNLNLSFMSNTQMSQGNILGISHLDSPGLVENSKRARHMGFRVHITVNPYRGLPYQESLPKSFPSKVPNTESLDLDSTTDLLLEYFPEEGQWKLLDQLGGSGDSVHDSGNQEVINGNGQNRNSSIQVSNVENVIEPSYVILDTELQQQSAEECEMSKRPSEKDKRDEFAAARIEEMMCLVRNIILDTLKIEVGRKLGPPDIKAMESSLACELEQIANVASASIRKSKGLNLGLGAKDPAGKLGTLQVEHVIRAISSSVQDCSHLRKVLPVGVIVGSCLAALREHFHVTTLNDDDQKEATKGKTGNTRDMFYGSESEDDKDHHQIINRCDKDVDSDSLESHDHRTSDTAVLNKDNVMAGAVTAALGASVLLVHHDKKHGSTGDPSGPISDQKNPQKEHYKLQEMMQARNQNNIVTSLAEKAMSVAAPVVPTKDDGEVDHERLVAILTDLGQKGGILRFVGKVALLWGGLRGAMSLTDRLISFLHIAERPTFQRILGFVCMVLVLWTPVVIPLLPTLVQNWTRGSTTGIAEYACIIGLYVAVVILVVLWGKRIRGYSNPLEQYGVGVMSSSKLHGFLKGLIGGVLLVLMIHSIHALLGFASVIWSPGLPSSSAGAILWLKFFGRMLLLAARAIVPAIGVALVEELLFRSWLPEEIAVDLGHHQAIIISGLAFSLLQRSLSAVPGLWLFSLALAGAKQMGHGDLSVPVGLRTGAMTASFILQAGGFLTYQPNAPLWVTGIYPWQPFGGAIGLAFCIVLAVFLYPRQPLNTRKIS